jgi:hypothetical protein
MEEPVLTPKEFARRAGFPKKWYESHLQTYVVSRLREMGYEAIEEVKMQRGSYRADIVTDWASPKTIIEMKPIFSSDNIYKGSRQVQIYTRHLGGQRKILMGLLPSEERDRRSVEKLAASSRLDGIDVIFLNCEPQWYPADRSGFFQKWFSWALPFIRSFAKKALDEALAYLSQW